MESDKYKVLKNSKWNIISFAIVVFFNLISVPYVVNQISLAEFGEAGFVVSVYAPFLIIGIVSGQVVTKELAPTINAWKLGDDVPANLIIASLLWSALFAILVVAVLAFSWNLLSVALPQFIKPTSEWQLYLFVAGIGFFAQQLIFVLQGIVAACQNFKAIALLNIASSFLGTSVLLLACYHWKNALGFLIGTTIGFLLALSLWVASFPRIVQFKLRFGCPKVHDFRVLWTSYKLQGASYVFSAISNQSDRYSLAMFWPITALGQYNIAMRLQEVVHMALLKVTEVALPHFAITINDDIKKRAEYFSNANLILNILAAGLLSPLIPLADSLVYLWIGPAVGELAGAILRTLALASIFGAGFNLYFYLAVGTGRQIQLAIQISVHSVLAIIFSVLLLFFLGPIVAGLGYLMANIIRLLIASYDVNKQFEGKLSWADIFASSIFPLTIGACVGLLIFELHNLSPTTWFHLALYYLLISSIVILLTSGLSLFFVNGRRVSRLVKSSLKQEKQRVS